jgi:hypothetical protein
MLAVLNDEIVSYRYANYARREANDILPLHHSIELIYLRNGKRTVHIESYKRSLSGNILNLKQFYSYKFM